MKKFILISLSILLLASCKTEIEGNISLNDLLNSPPHVQSALLNIEIASCDDYKDSRKESRSLLEAKANIPDVFPNAKYKECYRKEFKSYASFNIPIGVGSVDLSSKDPKANIMIVSSKTSKLVIISSPELVKNINNYLKRSLSSDLDLDIILNVKNDTGKTQDFTIYGAYFNGNPAPLEDIKINRNETVKIKLSNVSADSLWNIHNKVGKAEKIGVVKVLTSPLDMNKGLEQNSKVNE